MPTPILAAADAEKYPARRVLPRPGHPDYERLRDAWERHKHDPVRNADGPPATDYLTDLRSLAKALSMLALDLPETRALLDAAGLPHDALAPRHLVTLSMELLGQVERHHASAVFDVPWAKMPYPHRDENPTKPGLNTRRLSEVAARPVDWLWPQRVPLGKLTLINGDPDLGKTWTVLDMIARVTTGRPFPDGPNPFADPSRMGSDQPRRNALWVSGEDEDEDTILPRIRMLGGDPSRVHSLSFVLDGGKQRALSLGDHLDWLDAWLYAHPLVAVVALDPFAAFLGKIDSHRNSDVRGLLTPLSKLASRHQVAVVGINHLAKGDSDNAMYRSMGSVGIVAAARSSWLVSRDPKEPADRRLLTKVKNNLATEDIGGLAFRVGPRHGGIFWEDGRVSTSADEALRSPRQDGSHAPARQEAKEWLLDLLKDGPVPAADAWEKAKADGVTERTLKYAKKELGVVSKKKGGTGDGWEWRLPK